MRNFGFLEFDELLGGDSFGGFDEFFQRFGGGGRAFDVFEAPDEEDSFVVGGDEDFELVVVEYWRSVEIKTELDVVETYNS